MKNKTFFFFIQFTRLIELFLFTYQVDVVLCTSWTCRAQHRLDAEVCKLNVVAQKRYGRPRKSWDEVIENDRKKLDLDSADPQNCSEWRAHLRETQPSVEENGL